MEFVNAGPEFYKKVVFACFCQQNPGRLCEHDLFNIFEKFKQRDASHFYKELINDSEIDRDYLYK